MADRPKFEYMKYGSRHLTPERRAELVAAVADGDAYIVGGFSALLRGEAGMQTTEIVSPHPILESPADVEGTGAADRLAP